MVLLGGTWWRRWGSERVYVLRLACALVARMALVGQRFTAQWRSSISRCGVYVDIFGKDLQFGYFRVVIPVRLG